jgi:uroporphyrinogen decarboxylase
MELKNDILLRTLKGEATERKPIWLMRQAGRILPEYRATRERAKNFIGLVTNPELAAEVTVQPVDILGVDAAIIFSDILVIPEAMGLPYQMIESKGPNFPQTVQNMADVERLEIADAEVSLRYVTEAIKITKQMLEGRVPLIGFAGAPWTIFSYMVEGSGSKTFSKAKAMLYQQPDLAYALLEKITLSTIDYLKAQIRAGADVVQLFDSWAGILSPEAYNQFAIPYINQICEAITEVPMIVFAKGAFFAMDELGKLPCTALGLDWNMSPQVVRAQVGKDMILQGNLDPCMLYAPDDVLVQGVKDMLHAFGDRHIVNLGHGLYPDIDAQKVKLMIQTVKDFSGQASTY